MISLSRYILISIKRDNVGIIIMFTLSSVDEESRYVVYKIESLNPAFGNWVFW